MKQLFIISIIALGLTSCEKKCYHCDNGIGGQQNYQMDVCPNDPYYDSLEDGQVLTDNVGNVLTCDKQ
jgi:hypothetical protein